MMHPHENDLALFAGGDLGCFRRWRMQRHLAGCDRCRFGVDEFSALRTQLRDLEEMPTVHWARLAAEMKANIRLGLAADSKSGLFDAVDSGFRVGLTDIDLNLHLNNARYLKYMDLSRLEHMLATGLLWRMIRARCNSVVANTEISYIRELRTWQKFSASARIVGWDEKYFYYEQRFESEGRLCTHAFIRLASLHGGKSIPVAQVMDRMGLDAVSPELPAPVLLWRDMLAAKREFSRNAPQDTRKHHEDPRHVA